MADARTIFDIDLAGMAKVLHAFDGLISAGSVVVCVASMAGHLGDWSPEIIQALDDPLTSPDLLAAWLIPHGRLPDGATTL